MPLEGSGEILCPAVREFDRYLQVRLELSSMDSQASPVVTELRALPRASLVASVDQLSVSAGRTQTFAIDGATSAVVHVSNATEMTLVP